VLQHITAWDETQLSASARHSRLLSAEERVSPDGSSDWTM
jgi:hypothetical protein